MIPSGNQTWQWKNTNVPSFKPPSIRDCPLFVGRVPHQKYIAITQRIYILYKHMSGGQNYLLIAMDIAKVGGSLSVVKVYMFMVCNV